MFGQKRMSAVCLQSYRYNCWLLLCWAKVYLIILLLFKYIARSFAFDNNKIVNDKKKSKKTDSNSRP